MSTQVVELEHHAHGVQTEEPCSVLKALCESLEHLASNMLREAMELCQELLPHLALRSQQLLTCEVLQALAQRLEH